MRSPIAVVALVGVGALALGACGADGDADEAASTGPAAPNERTAVVVDTDAGLDDAIALLYLARSPEVELLAVTVSGTGLAHCFPGARNVVGLLESVGRADVPVACGPEQPLGSVGRAFPDPWRRFTDSRYADAWRIGRGPVDDRPAAELLVDTVRGQDAARPLTLVTLGPLTNVAAALALDGEIGDGIERVIAMAGAFDVGGNVEFAEPAPERNVAEWNVYADPQAARIVVHSGLPITFVPLDATNSVPFDLYLLRAVAHAPDSDALDLTRALLARIRGSVASGDYFLWDPLAAVLALHPELGSTQTRAIDVVIDGPEAGRTATAEQGSTVELFTAADGRAAEMALLEVLAGGAVPTITTGPDLVIDPVACTTSATDVGAGPQILQLEPLGGAATDRAVAVGMLDPGRGIDDIEAFLADPGPEIPTWFTPTATLGTGEGDLAGDLVVLEPGTHTVVCVSGELDALELAGTTTFDVSG